MKYQILIDRKTGKELHARPAGHKIPLAMKLTEERDFDSTERELTVDEALAVNGQRPVKEVITASAKDAQAVFRAKLEELGYSVKVVL